MIKTKNRNRLINKLKNLVSAVFNSRAIRRSVSSKFIEICMETPCWCPSGWAPRWRPETNRNICHLDLLRKRKFISRGTQKHQNNTFPNARTRSESQISRNKSRNKSLFSLRPSCKYRVTQKLRNSSVVCRKTKNPFGTKIGLNISFQLLLYLIKVKYQQDQ